MWTDLPDALGYDSVPWFLVLGLPLVGAAIVWLARRFLPGDGGHNPLGGLNATPTPPRFGLGVALAALGSLPFGIVLGPEAPLIALGSVVGLSVTAWARLGEQERAVVATGGSFAAIAALFGGPLVAGVLLIEAGISKGRALIAALVPGLVAAAIGYTIFIGVGDWGGIDKQTLTIPGLPAYHGTKVRDLVIAVVVGLVAALLMALVRRLGGAIERARPETARHGRPAVRRRARDRRADAGRGLARRRVGSGAVLRPVVGRDDHRARARSGSSCCWSSPRVSPTRSRSRPASAAARSSRRSSSASRSRRSP